LSSLPLLFSPSKPMPAVVVWAAVGSVAAELAAQEWAVRSEGVADSRFTLSVGGRVMGKTCSIGFQKPRAVADREFRRNRKTALLDVDEELTPALRAFAHPSL
jgi:hypothetical protein